jgi:hypothetical protein
MSDTTEFIIGSEVSCRDGGCGQLRRVIVDPIARTLTHLVVEPRHRRATGHLIPIDLVATDGAIGRVQGLVINPSDQHVTHMLLDQGHLWGHQRVAIAISAVADVDDGVRLHLTKDEVRDLPPVDLEHE